MTRRRQHLLDNDDDGSNNGQPPPTYESISSPSSHRPPTTTSTANNPRGNRNTASVPQQPAPQPVRSSAVVLHANPPPALPASSAFNRYSQLRTEHGIVCLYFVFDPRVPRTSSSPVPPWEATLTIKCPDVPRLMREGLFWSGDNIVPEEGCMYHIGRQTRTPGYSHLRTWVLTSDKPESQGGGHGTIPQWVACLEVSATAIETLSEFRPGQTMTRAHIWMADAWDVHGRPIYHHDSYAPAQSYNCVYDDMPLRGWWPWPRGEDRE